MKSALWLCLLICVVVVSLSTLAWTLADGSFANLELYSAREAPAPAATAPASSPPNASDFLGCRPIAELIGDTPAARFVEMKAACPISVQMKTGALLVDPDGLPVATQTKNACGYYALTGASVITGAVAEFGTWCGASMRCLAYGVNVTGKVGRAFGFDNFAVGFAPGNFAKLEAVAKGSRFEKQIRKERGAFDMRELFFFYTRSVYPSIVAQRVPNLNKLAHGELSVFGAADLDVWTTDAAKDWSSVRTQLNFVQSRLRPGSIIILADMYYCAKEEQYDQAPQVYEQLVGTSKLELLAVASSVSHAWFAVRGELGALKKPLKQSRSSLMLAKESARIDLHRVGSGNEIARQLECVDKIFDYHIKHLTK